MVAPTPVPFFIMVGLYLLSMAAIGIYAAKRTTNLREFFVMNAKAGAILSGLAYFSTQYSMSTFMGVPGTCYKVGYSGLAVSVPGLVFSMIIPALFVGRKLIALGKKHKFLTMADYLGDRYDSQGIRVLLALMMLFFLIPLMGAQTIGAGVIVNVFTGLPYWVGVVAMGVIVIFYCMSGGIWGGHFDGRRSGNPHGGYGYRDFHSIRCHGRRILCHQRENRIGQPGTAYLPR